MIYLIGGPPKCGKTTLAKKLAKELGIQWVSSDTLQVVSRAYVCEFLSKEAFDERYPHSAQRGASNDEIYSQLSPEQIAENYIVQAKASYDAVDMFSICEIKDGNDYIIEGYHVTPELADKLVNKYGAEHFRVLFIVKEDSATFLENLKKSTTPNDWILTKTKDENTFPKIAAMISYYGKHFSKEASIYGFTTINMDEDFEAKLDEAVGILTSKCC
jgi:2-phosphoglycerate kinase